MPSIKMKTKSTLGCFRENKGLGICQNSSVISKNSLSRLKISQQAIVCDASIQDFIQGVSLCETACTLETGEDEAVDYHRLFDGANLLFHKQLSSTMDPSAAGKMESLPSISTSNYETIFSPSLEYNNLQSEQNACTEEGGNKDFDAPQLQPDDSDHSRSICEYQTCNVSDFYVSDMIVSSFPVQGNSVHDYTEVASFPDYTCDEPNVFCDVADEFMMLPLLEDTMDTSGCLYSRTCGESVVHADNSSLYLAIHQLRSCNQESDVDSFLDLDPAEYFDPHIYIRNLPDQPGEEPSFRPVTLAQEAQKTKSVTLVLDLDETLVHSSLEECDDADFTFPVYFNMREHIVYVKQRPYLQPFLERVAEMFEIVVFTASQSIYAKQLLDILDPDGKLISRRAYRESCVFTDGSYTKDLTVLGVDLAKVVIIDNSPQVFRLQVNNGIPIKSWFDDPSDHALISLLPFLETLVDADDVRPIIAKRFGNKE